LGWRYLLVEKCLTPDKAKAAMGDQRTANASPNAGVNSGGES